MVSSGDQEKFPLPRLVTRVGGVTGAKSVEGTLTTQTSAFWSLTGRLPRNAIFLLLWDQWIQRLAVVESVDAVPLGRSVDVLKFCTQRSAVSLAPSYPPRKAMWVPSGEK